MNTYRDKSREKQTDRHRDKICERQKGHETELVKDRKDMRQN